MAKASKTTAHIAPTSGGTFGPEVNIAKGLKASLGTGTLFNIFPQRGMFPFAHFRYELNSANG
jgi:hypothetical protein